MLFSPSILGVHVGRIKLITTNSNNSRLRIFRPLYIFFFIISTFITGCNINFHNNLNIEQNFNKEKEIYEYKFKNQLIKFNDVEYIKELLK